MYRSTERLSTKAALTLDQHLERPGGLRSEPEIPAIYHDIPGRAVELVTDRDRRPGRDLQARARTVSLL